MTRSHTKEEATPALVAGGISAGVSAVDTAIICVLTGFSIPIIGTIGIGIGIFAILFAAFACCHVASKADEPLGCE